MEVGNDVKPEGVTLVEGAIVKYIGIEDNPKGDLDYNDVVLAVVGNPDVPEEIKIEKDEYQVPVSVTKRYMMEDLGSTDDFDFNDVVVDVTETTVYTHKVTIVNGVKESDVVIDTKKTQKAVVRHLGGILPFQLTIGETTLPEMGSEATWKTNPDTEYEVKGWNPAQNNVSVTVKSTESQMYNVTNKFPKEGELISAARFSFSAARSAAISSSVINLTFLSIVSRSPKVSISRYDWGFRTLSGVRSHSAFSLSGSRLDSSFFGSTYPSGRRILSGIFSSSLDFFFHGELILANRYCQFSISFRTI